MKMKIDSIFITTCIFGFLALMAFVIAYQKGKLLAGLEIGKNLCLKLLPLIILAFILAGLIEVLIPQNLISSWIGKKSGFKGILIGTGLGMIMPGNPYIVLPILAGIYKSGGSIPVIVSIYSAKFLTGLNRLPIEIGILGLRFTAVRMIATLILPPLAGLISQEVVKIIK